MSQQTDGSEVTSVTPTPGELVTCPPPYPIGTVQGRTLREDSSPFLKEWHKGTRQEESAV